MNISLKPYPEYKDSGQPWLGSVPQHWFVMPNRALFTEVNDRNHPDEEMLSVTITRGVMRQKALLENSSKKDSSNLDKSAYKLVCPGDIAYNKMRAWQGAIGASDYRGIISPAYIVMRPRDDNNPRYFHYLYRTPRFAKEAERWSYGITSDMWSLRAEHFKVVYSAIPSREEQDDIVRFLDLFDRRIDRLIRAKRRLIELLNEQKQAVIHRAVTRGLDPNVRLKPSSIDWLGDVPKHWDIPLFGRCLHTIEQGWSPTAAEGEIIEEQWAVLTLSAVKKGMFYVKAIKPIPLSAKVPNSIEVHDGDFLLTRSNTRNLVGDVCVVEGVRPRTILCDLIYRLQLDKNSLLPRFLMYLLLSSFGRVQIESDARGSSHTMVKLGQGHIKRWRILVPPLNEQQRIIENVDLECGKVGDATSRIKYEIHLLREYRTRLIADVVTGKLDVRGVKLPAKDEIEEPDDVVTGEDAETEALDDLEENDG